MTEISSDEIERLDKLGTFFVCVYPEKDISSANLWQRIPPHQLVIEPIVANASETRIIGFDDDSPVLEHILALGTRRRGYLEVDLSREVVKGYEAVWNACRWQRGSIVLAAHLDDQQLGDIFSWCGGPKIWSSLSQLKKGTPVSSITYAQSVARNGSFAFSFTASNGIEVMDIFASPTELRRCYAIAKERCRLALRLFQYPDDREVISIEDPCYTSMI